MNNNLNTTSIPIPQEYYGFLFKTKFPDEKIYIGQTTKEVKISYFGSINIAKSPIVRRKNSDRMFEFWKDEEFRDKRTSLIKKSHGDLDFRKNMKKIKKEFFQTGRGKQLAKEQSERMKKRTPWNKGLTKDDPRVDKNTRNAHRVMRKKNSYRKNSGSFKKGMVPHNKGKINS